MEEINADMKKLEGIIMEGAELMGYEVVKWRYRAGKKGLLQIYIDKEGGITLEDCIKFNKYLNNVLDEKDPIPTSYVLEVSSPGVVRYLENDKDYEKAKNKWVILVTKDEIEGKREFSGELIEITNDFVILKEDAKLHKVLKKHILKARIDTPIFRKK